MKLIDKFKSVFQKEKGWQETNITPRVKRVSSRNHNTPGAFGRQPNVEM